MKDTVLVEVSEILNVFNIDEITSLINTQINKNYANDNSTDTMVDHLQPLYYTYAKTIANENIDDDTKREAQIRFYSICQVFIDAICEKYKLCIDTEWIEDNRTNLPAVTLALYSLFVLDFSTNIYEILLNYIMKNSSTIYKVFEEMRNKKDSSTLSNKKTMSPELALIISNIYDISSWIFNNMTEDEFFEYVDNEYLPLKIIKILFEDGKISGDFMEAINSIFQTNICLKSKTCFNIIYQFRNGDIKDPTIRQ